MIGSNCVRCRFFACGPEPEDPASLRPRFEAMTPKTYIEIRIVDCLIIQFNYISKCNLRVVTMGYIENISKKFNHICTMHHTKRQTRHFSITALQQHCKFSFTKYKINCFTWLINVFLFHFMYDFASYSVCQVLKRY